MMLSIVSRNLPCAETWDRCPVTRASAHAASRMRVRNIRRLYDAAQAFQPFGEDGRLGQQTNHQERLGFEIEEVSGLDQNIAFLEQLDRPFFFGSGTGHLKHRVPPALCSQERR